VSEDGLAAREVKISWSMLRVHEECTEKAYLRSRGMKSPVTDIRPYFRGTVVDRCMRDWLCAEDQEPGGMAAMVDEVLDREEESARESGDGVVRWKSPADRDESRAWCRELVTRLEPILRRCVLPFDYEPALRFSVPLRVPYLDDSPQRVWLRGEMDLLVRDSQARHAVWDLKATENTDYWRKCVGQLVFYDIVVRVMTGAHPVGCGLIQPMCPEQVLPFVFTQQQRSEVVQRILGYCRSVWRGEHRPKEGTAGCSFCEVRHACPRYAGQGRGRVAWPVSAA